MNDKRSMSEEERIKLIYDLKSLIQKATEEFSDNTLLDSLNEIKCLFDMGYAEEYIKNPDFDGLADAYKCFNSKNKKKQIMTEKKKMTIGELKEMIKTYPDYLPIAFECSCSSSGGYDGWNVEIELVERLINPFIEFKLEGYHNWDDEND